MRLAEFLTAKFKISMTVRSQEKADELTRNGYSMTLAEFSEDQLDIREIWSKASDLDVIIVLVPFSIRKSSPDRLKVKMKNLCAFIGDFEGQLFFSSSTGVYPKEGTVYFEKDLAVTDNVVENEIAEHFPQVNILRLAGLMGDERYLSKYKISNLEEPVNHVHYDDVCAVIAWLIERQAHRCLYNVVAPLHPSKGEVINAQKGEIVTKTSDPEGRIISSEKLIVDINYTFKYPDPRAFQLVIS